LRILILAALLLPAVGCGGLHASYSVSPASFFLPGLLQADPPPADPNRDLPEVAPAKELAQL
jgi:hypothetical protein